MQNDEKTRSALEMERVAEEMQELQGVISQCQLEMEEERRANREREREQEEKRQQAEREWEQRYNREC